MPTRDEVVLVPSFRVVDQVEPRELLELAEGKVEAWAVCLKGEQLERLQRIADRRAGQHGRSKPIREDYALALVRAVYRGLVELDTRPVDDE